MLALDHSRQKANNFLIADQPNKTKKSTVGVAPKIESDRAFVPICRVSFVLLCASPAECPIPAHSGISASSPRPNSQKDRSPRMYRLTILRSPLGAVGRVPRRDPHLPLPLQGIHR